MFSVTASFAYNQISKNSQDLRSVFIFYDLKACARKALQLGLYLSTSNRTPAHTVPNQIRLVIYITLHGPLLLIGP